MRRFNKATEARRRARRAHKPGATKVVPDKRRKPPKHKKPYTGDVLLLPY